MLKEKAHIKKYSSQMRERLTVSVMLSMYCPYAPHLYHPDSPPSCFHAASHCTKQASPSGCTWVMNPGLPSVRLGPRGSRASALWPCVKACTRHALWDYNSLCRYSWRHFGHAVLCAVCKLGRGNTHLLGKSDFETNHRSVMQADEPLGRNLGVLNNAPFLLKTVVAWNQPCILQTMRLAIGQRKICAHECTQTRHVTIRCLYT